MPIGAAIGGVGALASAGASIWGAHEAAGAQMHAADLANATANKQMDLNQQNFAPWMTGGANAFGAVQKATGTNPGGDPTTAWLTSKFNPTQAQLEQTPGYNWTLGQGLKSTQNSYASKGLGSSGAAMKGAADYAGGLASNTYQQQFQNYWNQNKSIYDMLTGQSTAGLQAASGVTGANTNLTNSQMGATIGAGNAQAAMYNSFGPAISGAFNGAGNAYNNSQAYNLLGGYLSNGTSNNVPWAQRPEFGGGNGVWGGSSQNPMPRLNASDYGAGY